MKPIKCLIVDDEPLARDLLRRFIAEHPALELTGEAGDGVKAFDLILDQKPDLLFLDVQMPEMNGLELLEAVKQEGVAPLTIFRSRTGTRQRLARSRISSALACPALGWAATRTARWRSPAASLARPCTPVRPARGVTLSLSRTPSAAAVIQSPARALELAMAPVR